MCSWFFVGPQSPALASASLATRHQARRTSVLLWRTSSGSCRRAHRSDRIENQPFHSSTPPPCRGDDQTLRPLKSGARSSLDTATRPVLPPRSPIGRRNASAFRPSGDCRSVTDRRERPHQKIPASTCHLPTWWFQRSGCTRSHPELGRETLQRL